MTFKRDLIRTLSKKNKIILSKYHYDFRGSKLFEKITQQKDYYPTRKEKEILRKIAPKIKKLFKGKLSYVEIGSGAINKISIIINKQVKFYVPIDISYDFIKNSTKKLKRKFPFIKTIPVKADYSKKFKIPTLKNTTKIFFFLGSSIGNFHNKEEISFLKKIKNNIGKNNFLFVGVDLIKSKVILEQAYNDRKGYTSKFSMNLINIINKSFNAKLNKKNFYYVGKYNTKLKSIQGFIVSKIRQSFYLNQKKFKLKKNEKIQVEVSNKYTIKSFSSLSKLSGWSPVNYWLDKNKYYSLFLLKS